MIFEDLKFNPLTIKENGVEGIHANVRFGRYEISVIRHTMSYGNKKGLYEIGVFLDGTDMIELPGITDEGNTIKGHLCEEGVTNIFKKMYMMTGEMGESVV